jgi:hypothetical protein
MTAAMTVEGLSKRYPLAPRGRPDTVREVGRPALPAGCPGS